MRTQCYLVPTEYLALCGTSNSLLSQVSRRNQVSYPSVLCALRPKAAVGGGRCRRANHCMLSTHSPRSRFSTICDERKQWGGSCYDTFSSRSLSLTKMSIASRFSWPNVLTVSCRPQYFPWDFPPGLFFRSSPKHDWLASFCSFSPHWW